MKFALIQNPSTKFCLFCYVVFLIQIVGFPLVPFFPYLPCYPCLPYYLQMEAISVLEEKLMPSKKVVPQCEVVIQSSIYPWISDREFRLLLPLYSVRCLQERPL